jgi:hypothetical protein
MFAFVVGVACGAKKCWYFTQKVTGHKINVITVIITYDSRHTVALSAIVFNNTGKVLSKIGLNRACGIDEGSKPIVGFFQPMITCCFIQEDLIYFTVHHRVTSMCYNFIYSHATDSVLSRVGETRIKHSTLVNFPNKSFYNSIDNEIYTFYRQGQCITRPSYLESEA